MSREIELSWIDTPVIDFRAHAFNAGYNIDSFEKFSDKTKAELKSKTIRNILRELDGIWYDSAQRPFSQSFADVDRGLYVMALANNLSMRYPNGHSRVIYIGEGAIRNRIYHHLHEKLFNIFLGLQGVGFCFHFAEPRKNKKTDFYKDVEYDFLEYFKEKYGEYPLYNEKSGRTHNGDNSYATSALCKLTNRGRNIQWIIEQAR